MAKGSPCLWSDRVTFMPCSSGTCLSGNPSWYSWPIVPTLQWGTPHKETFVSRLKQGLSSAGIDSSGYNGHSFRIGAATTAARVGIPDSILAGGNHLHTAYTSELLQNSLQEPSVCTATKGINCIVYLFIRCFRSFMYIIASY